MNEEGLLPSIVTSLERTKKLVGFQVWPLAEDFDVEGWLSNFQDDELEKASILLSKFMFFSEKLTNELFKSAFHDISNHLAMNNRKSNWKAFSDTCIVTYPTGETPNPTDSGPLFSRKARQQIGIDENNICSPQELLEFLESGRRAPIVFVDDFAGSGNQFVETWEREYTLESGATTSIKETVSKIKDIQVHYVVCISTSMGKDRIEETCLPVIVHAANIVGDSYSVISLNSHIWPEGLKFDGPNFVKKASERAGIPDTGGGEDDWRGFYFLGMTLAFAHSTPDATIPLFYWEKNGWIPLLRRS